MAWCKNVKYKRPVSSERYDQNSELKKLVFTSNEENLVIDELLQNKIVEGSLYSDPPVR